MGYTLEELQQRLLEHHSDIAKHGVKFTVSFELCGRTGEGR